MKQHSGLPIPVSTPAPRTPSPWMGAVFMALGALCIGYAPIGLKYSDLGPQATAFWRYVFAIPILFALVAGTHKRLPVRPPAAIFIAGTCFALDIGLWHAALTYTSVANATFIVNLGNIGVGLLAWWLLKEKPKPVWAVAATVALVGAGCLSMGGAGTGGVGDLRGDVMALGAAIMVSFYMVYSKIARGAIDALSAIFWLTVVEAVVGLMLVLITGEALFPSTIWGFWAALSLAIVAQVAGQGLIVLGLGLTPAAIAGLLMLLQPVTASVLAWNLFGEALNGVQLAGCGLILVGLALSQRR